MADEIQGFLRKIMVMLVTHVSTIYDLGKLSCNSSFCSILIVVINLINIIGFHQNQKECQESNL